MQSRNIRFQISDFRFQISDFRFQIPTPAPAGRQISSGDFIFQISDPRRHNGRNIDGKQNSKRAEHISRLHHRFLRHPDFRFQIPKFARLLISDFRFQISDPRTPATPRHRFQISENRFQKSRATSQRWADFRFQIPQRSRPVWHLHCRFQISEYSDPPECHPGMVCQNSRCQISESKIQIPGAKKSVRVP